MIRISKSTTSFTSAAPEDVTRLQQAIFRGLLSRPETFSYPSGRELNFELRMRERTLEAARALNASGAAFASFARTRANPEYWTVEPNGAIRLRPDRSPAAAIRDIFINGPLYAFECATAVVIVLYKAVLDTIGEAAYNRLFGNTYLFHWNVDRDLGLRTLPAARFIPGDVVYFDNPEVDPRTPEWQGENAIYMGNDMYYGHGIGIRTPEQIIAALNNKRRPGATISAYLTEQVTRPNYVLLSQSSASFTGGSGGYPGLPGSVYFRAAIGSSLYLFA
ncbi:protein-glutamine gamma-glutamyltransferase [Paenibacillus alkalitolerans]|uniref:protein-glutamine gamma-glutamyltransferase n=1 Tax=Paenibacillus alkalitolerans TaxID=2799335 RepID=UPI0018F6E02D|nr:protein-glutamine gamma-glutamyltransferase [Paenibacillus alkalitolerans]